MTLKWNVEETDLMPVKAHGESYSELYQMLDDRQPDQKPLRIGPMERKEARSVQSSINTHFSKDAAIQIFTRIADKKGQNALKGSIEQVYLYINKVTRKVEDEEPEPQEQE